MPEQAVIVRFAYGLKNLDPLFELEDRVKAAIDGAGVGEFDGDEVATDLRDGTLYMYGPDADALFRIVQPILLSSPFMQEARVLIRYCPAQDGVPERQVVLRR